MLTWWLPGRWVWSESVGLIAWQRGEGQEHYHKVSFVFTNAIEQKVSHQALATLRTEPQEVESLFDCCFKEILWSCGRC